MPVDEQDIQALRWGQPPADDDLLQQMTLGQEQWLDYIHDHYLAHYIADGGSKVKVMVGQAGSGKTHLLRYIQAQASSLGYATVYLSARDYRLNNLVNLYQALVSQIDLTALVEGLCHQIALKVGYDDPSLEQFLPKLMELQGLTRDLAVQDVKKAIGDHLRHVDLGPSFLAFAHKVIQGQLIESNRAVVRIALRWLSGEKLDRQQKQLTRLFERLQKSNARYWLYSLIRLLKLAGYQGLVVAIDQLEVMTERSGEKRRYKYSPSAVKDICELFRQLIDDVELLDHFLLLLAGRREVLDDERRGFKSYEALWMRLQTGLTPTQYFNPLADIFDADRHLEAQGVEFPDQVATRLYQLCQEFQSSGSQLNSSHLNRSELTLESGPMTSDTSPLRSRVIDIAMKLLETSRYAPV